MSVPFLIVDSYVRDFQMREGYSILIHQIHYQFASEASGSD